MKTLALLFALLVAGCGGGRDEEEDPAVARAAAWAEARESAEHFCADHRGMGKIIKMDARYFRDGRFRDLTVWCQCSDGHLYSTTSKAK